jgi:hypothetical protein
MRQDRRERAEKRSFLRPDKAEKQRTVPKVGFDERVNRR